MIDMEIIPAILAKDEGEFVAKAGRLAPLGLTVQIDVIDGKFVPNITWAPPEAMKGIFQNNPYEAHLMVADPEHQVPIWVAAGAARVYYHAEATQVDMLIYKSMGNKGNRLGVAINPDTPVSRVAPLLTHIKNVLVMGVNPGWSGQPFQEIALDKVRALRATEPDLHITVDGGVTPEIAVKLAAAGADAVVMGKSLTDQADPFLALAKIREIVK